MAPDCVDLVDEDDAGRVLLGLLEHVAHAARADADEHFDEVGAGNGEEGHIGFAGDGARQQGLAGAGRSDQQHAARNAPAEPLESLRIAQEFDDLLQILLGLVDARDILKGDPAMRLGQKLRLRLAEAHGLAAGALHLPRQEDPHAENRDERQPVDEQRQKPVIAVGRRLRRNRDVLFVETLHQRRIIRRIGRERAIIRKMAGDLIAGDGHFAHMARVDLGQQLAEADVLRGRALSRVLEQHHQRHHEQDNDHPQCEVTKIRIHFQVLMQAKQARRLIACR